VALAALVVTSPAAQGAQPWHVDPSFGIGGIQSLHYGNLGRASLPASFVPGASGLYWVLSLDADAHGNASRRLVVRLKDDGTLGQLGGGKAFTTTTGFDPDADVAHDAAGDLFTFDAGAGSLARVDPLSLLRDPNYQVALPKPSTADCSATDGPTAFAVDPAGRVLVATGHFDSAGPDASGFLCTDVSFTQVRISRYTSVGTLDPSFGVGGSISIPGAFGGGIFRIVAAKNGRVYAGLDDRLLAFTQAGVPDPTFAGTGTRTISGALGVLRIVELPNGALDVYAPAQSGSFDVTKPNSGPPDLIQLSSSGATLHKRNLIADPNVLAFGLAGAPTVLRDGSVRFVVQDSTFGAGGIGGAAVDFDHALHSTLTTMGLANLGTDPTHPRSTAPWNGAAGLAALPDGDLLIAVSPRSGVLDWARLTQRAVHAPRAPSSAPRLEIRSAMWISNATPKGLKGIRLVAARATYACATAAGCPMASASWVLYPTVRGEKIVRSGAPERVFPGPLFMVNAVPARSNCNRLAAGTYRLQVDVQDIYGRRISSQRRIHLAKPDTYGICAPKSSFRARTATGR